jgi:hypothetical protein
MTQNATEIMYSIPEDELERILLNCAAHNNCVTKDNKIADSCSCYKNINIQPIGNKNETK